MRLKSQPPGSNPSLQAQIPASRLKSHPRGSNLMLEAQIPSLRLRSHSLGLNSSLEAQITASRLKSAHTDRRKDGRTNESPPVFYRTSSPSGPLPCYPSPTITNIRSRATGIADHILPLGNWFPSPLPLPSNPRLEAQIPVMRPKSQCKGPNLSLQAQIPV